MSLIDVIVETAQRIHAQNRPVRLRDLHNSYLEANPDAVAGRSPDSFAATLNFHCINMRSRFPDPQNKRARASWLTRPLFKRVDRGEYTLLSEQEIRAFRTRLEQDDPLIWRDEYGADELLTGITDNTQLGATASATERGEEIAPRQSASSRCDSGTPNTGAIASRLLSENAPDRFGRSDQLVARLLELGTQISSADFVFSGDSSVGDLLRNEPFAFLLAASVDRGMAAEAAWQLPDKLKSALGHLEPARLANMTREEMLIALKTIDGRPRYLGDAARTLVEVANLVVTECSGNARNLWKDVPAATIKRRLCSIYGIGPGIASMILIMLNREAEISFSPADLAGLDPKPDVHVRRVFQRLGFCEREPSERQAIEAARRLNPLYPGQLDGPAWHIGRKWCHAQNPECAACPVGDACPRIM